METELLADKLAQEDKLPEHRDDVLHMIVKDKRELRSQFAGDQALAEVLRRP